MPKGADGGVIGTGAKLMSGNKNRASPASTMGGARTLEYLDSSTEMARKEKSADAEKRKSITQMALNIGVDKK